LLTLVQAWMCYSPFPKESLTSPFLLNMRLNSTYEVNWIGQVDHPKEQPAEYNACCCKSSQNTIINHCWVIVTWFLALSLKMNHELTF